MRHRRFYLCTILSFLAAVNARTAVIKAKSVSLGDVSSAIGSARDGDTVLVPPGTAVWKDPLLISKNITLMGAGAESPIIIDEVNGPAGQIHSGNESSDMDEMSAKPAGVLKGGNARGGGRGPRMSGGKQGFLMSIVLERDLPFRLSGFSFRASPKLETTFNGRVRISGKSHAFRVDHCTFDHLNGANLSTAGFLWGVIDHCRFNTVGGHPIILRHEGWGGKDWGNGSWADDPYWGSEKFVFIEDNVFEDSGRAGTGIDSFEGARFVVRHNQFHNVRLVTHGTEGQGRGAKEVEDYNNNYVFTIHSQAGLIRSGSIISHDNTFTNMAKGHVLQAYRLFHYSRHWGMADGENPYDDNAPNPKTKYWEAGTHTGPNGSTLLVDSSKHWTPNEWYTPGASFVVRNITREKATKNDRDKIQSFVLSNTSDTITCSPKSFTNIPLTFNSGDKYEIWKVIHSLDQPGLGKGELMTGLPGMPAKWPMQVTEPCYSWNNTQEEKPVNLESAEPSIKEGRDFFNGTAKPGYHPFTYPHPLAKAER